MRQHIILAALALLVTPAPVVSQTNFQRYADQASRQQADSSHWSRDAAAIPQLTAGPQAISGDDAWGFLKTRAMGVVKGCDYAAYINLAQQIQSGWAAFDNWANWKESRDIAVPFLDFVSMFLRAGSTYVTKQSAEREAQGLVYQLEQVCNAAAQAAEIHRQYVLIAEANRNIGQALKWILDSADDPFSTPPGSTRERVLAEWATLYDDAVPTLNTMQDSLWLLVSSTLHETLKASDDMHQALERIQADINELRDALILTAEKRGDSFHCPEGYPDPNRPDVDYHKGMPVCGPVGPDRSGQILPQIELLKMQLQAIQLAADGRGLEVDAVRLMSDNYQRRVRHTTNVVGQLIR